YIKDKVGAKKIKLFVEGELIVVHERSWGLHKWVMVINHYLKTFLRRKGAISQSECLRKETTKIKIIYYDYYIGKEQKFIQLINYYKKTIERKKSNIDQREYLK